MDIDLTKIKYPSHACEYGYFSESALKRNKIKFDKDTSDKLRVYAGLSKKHVYVYKNDEAFKLYKSKSFIW